MVLADGGVVCIDEFDKVHIITNSVLYEKIIQWNLSYTDPMGLALVCGTSVIRPYLVCIIFSYTDPMGLVLVCISTVEPQL